MRQREVKGLVVTKKPPEHCVYMEIGITEPCKNKTLGQFAEKQTASSRTLNDRTGSWVQEASHSVLCTSLSFTQIHKRSNLSQCSCPYLISLGIKVAHVASAAGLGVCFHTGVGCSKETGRVSALAPKHAEGHRCVQASGLSLLNPNSTLSFFPAAALCNLFSLCV